MATLSEVLLAVNKVTQDLDTKVDASARVTKILVKVDDRVTARADMVDALKEAGLKQGANSSQTRPNFGSNDFVISKIPESSFDGIVIKETSTSVIRYIFKGKRGGSGAGAAETKKTESGQAVYAAVAFNLGRHITQADITPDTVEAAKGLFDVDETRENIFKMDDSWVSSCVKGANRLWDEFKNIKSRGVKFHRGSAEVNYIENQFKRVKKAEGVRIDINKWSPADIYVTTSGYKHKCLEEEQTLQGLNQCMMHRLVGDGQGPIMFGVSLKKITQTNAKLSKINVDPKTARDQFYDSFYRKGLKSSDIYMKFKSGVEIQFRGFDGPKSLTGFQGEVKGASANQGKVGAGSVNLILKLHGLRQIPNVASIVKAKGTQYAALEASVKKVILATSPSATETKYVQFIEEKAAAGELDGFMYAMGSAAALYDIITGITNKDKRDQVCEDLLLYASSKSIISAPYYKLE
tara:strand:+ start:91 stop:1485 length:1395 start_codon:yes stop_codon:yes gene_type:complete